MGITMKYLIAFLSVLVPAIAFAQEDYSDLFPTGKSTPEPVISNMYYSPNPVFTPQEEAGLKIANKWRSSNSTALKPMESQGGVILFVFGASQPSVICAVMQVCDIELQKGEVINDVNAGDRVRWNITPSVAGIGPKATPHLIIKPLDVGLETSMLVTTNRRTYHITLRSHRDQYMARVAFTYPDDTGDQWASYRKRNEERQPSALTPQQPSYTSEYLGDLDFDYDVSGKASWKPTRVFNDGRKTIIQMPKAMAETEAPALVVIRGKNSFWPWGSKEEEVMANYRIQPGTGRMIVDTVFDKAALVAGVGDNQDRVTIERVEK